jgi:hypothetical protein
MKLPAGTSVYVGAPAKPLDPEISEGIGIALRRIPGICEAHLPQMYIKDVVDPPEQVLIVVSEDRVATMLTGMGEALSRALPDGLSLTVFELSQDDPTLTAVRNAGCELTLRGH